MEGALDLLQSVARNGDTKSLTEYLQFCSESKLFSCSGHKREANIAFINSLLTSKDSFVEGLAVLDVFIEQCPKDFLSSNICSWIQLTIKGLVNPEDGSFCSLSWKVLGKLIQFSEDFPEARKNIALTVIPKVLDHVVREAKNAKEGFSTFLGCLLLTLRTYGKSCGFHKEALGALLFSDLEASPSSTYIAGQCFLQLAACGSPGAGRENYATSWLNQQKFLLNSLHSQLDALFDNINTAQAGFKMFPLEGTFPTISKITEKGFIKKKQRQAKQFQSLAIFLKIMLLGRFPSRKKILPESILALVWRGFATNCQTLAKLQQSIDTACLATVISTINLASLEILDALVISCKMNLLPFLSSICRIFSQSLKWTETETWPFGLTKPHSSGRVKIYDCLCNWLSVSRVCSGMEKYEDDLVDSILSDIHQEPPTVALKAPAGKGKKNKGNATSETAAWTEFIVNPEMNADVCEAALKALSVLLDTSSTLLKPIHHRNLQETVVKKAISVQEGVKPVPYSSWRCRLALYKALLALCLCPHPSYPPPINYATQIFSNGIKDSQPQVSMHCLFAIRTIEKMLRPVCPTLNFPTTEQNLPRIDVSTHDSEGVDYLLNDSRKRRSKRKREQQVTSTPVNNNHKRLFIANLDKRGELNENSTIVDSEMSEGGIEKTTKCNGKEQASNDNESIVSHIEAWSESEINKDKRVHTEESKEDADGFTDLRLMEEEPNREDTVTQTSAEIHGEPGSQEAVNGTHSPPRPDVTVSSQLSVSLQQTTNSEERSKLGESSSPDNDEDMLSSFVDEID